MIELGSLLDSCSTVPFVKLVLESSVFENDDEFRVLEARFPLVTLGVLAPVAIARVEENSIPRASSSLSLSLSSSSS